MTTELTVTGSPHHPAATEDRWADFTDMLEISGRTLSGTPTITEYTVASDGTASTSSDLTITNKAVNSSAITKVNGETIAANKAVTYTLAGGADGVDYRLQISVGTSASETLVVNVDITCSDS